VKPFIVAACPQAYARLTATGSTARAEKGEETMTERMKWTIVGASLMILPAAAYLGEGLVTGFRFQ
jgi:hypothetical protein